MRPRLLEDPVGPTLLRLAGPMVIGILSIILFNVVDTFWVGQLGATHLAAMSYTFPVVMTVTSVSMGISIGTTAVLSRAIGSDDRDAARRITTDALALALILVVIVAAVGLATLGPVFRALGANDTTLPLIREYMEVWFLGVGLIVIPMVGNGAIRAAGDTKTPSIVMLVAGGVNLVLDPLFIFGVGSFEGMGLRGAALATVIAYGAALSASLWILVKREQMVAFERPQLAQVLESWRRITRIGAPASATNLLQPISAGLLTRMVSSYGETAVAAFGVGTRLESLSMIGIMALSVAITPFVGQNFGANQPERIRAAVRFALTAALGWGAVAAILFALLAVPLARVFNDAPAVVEATSTYLWFIPLSYGPLGIAVLSGSVFNALDRPLLATFIVAVRLLVLALPLAYLGSNLFGLDGIFGGMSVANLTIGGIGAFMVLRLTRALAPRYAEKPSMR